MSNEYPNVYSCSPVLAADSTSATTITFGFNARFVRLVNQTAVSVFVNPKEAAATSAMAFLSTGEIFEFNAGASPVRLSGLGLTTTSTEAAKEVSLWALG